MYRLPEYLVFWDLIFGTRDHAELRNVLFAMQKDTVAKAVADLVRLFADIRLRKTAAFNLWTFITSQLRGLALLSIFEDRRTIPPHHSSSTSIAVTCLAIANGSAMKSRMAANTSGS